MSSITRGLWIAITIHLLYNYANFFGVATQSKGGTYVEATTDSYSFLPYTNSNTDHIVLQNMLFPGCSEVRFSGNVHSFHPHLCNVSTKNNKQFIITLRPDFQRSDEQPVTLEDIYFSYRALLKDNIRNIPQHESYKSITIQPYLDRLEVSFPYASVDNQTFFTNPILPAHLLANKSYAEYIHDFSQNPVTLSCAKLVKDVKDEKSLLIDVSECSSLSKKFYQLKYFADTPSLQQYITQHPETIDSIINSQTTRINYTGYQEYSVATQNYITAFFNEQKSLLSTESKKFILTALSFAARNKPEYFTPDSYIFEAYQSITGITQSLLQDQVAPRFIPNNLPNIMLFSGDYHQSYTISQKIPDNVVVSFVFGKAYDKLILLHNKDDEVVLGPLQSNYTLQYKFSEILRNITVGNNTYTIHAYSGSTLAQSYQFSIFYGPWSGSTLPPPSLQSGDAMTGQQNSLTSLPPEHIQPIHVLLYDTEPLRSFVASFQDILAHYKLSNYFRIEAISDKNLYEGRLQTKDYDMVLSTLSLGLRKDISNIFLSDMVSLNPSLYINQSLSNEISKYFLLQGQAKQQSYETIQAIYQDSIPLGFVTKIHQFYYNRNQNPSKHISRLPGIGWRQEFMNLHQGENTLKTINRNHAFSKDGFSRYFSTLFQLSTSGSTTSLSE